MPFWTYAERVEALTPPYRLKHHYRWRTEWEAERRAELGFTPGGHDQGVEFSHAKNKDRVAWNLVDRAVHWETARTTPRLKGDREEILWEVTYHSGGLLAEGVAASVEEAWDDACLAAGTDRLELGRAARVNWLRQARHKLKEFDRLAALQPEEAQAQPQRFVYAETRYDADIYDYSAEAQARRNRFRYRRFQLVRETAKFYFCDLRNSTSIDRDGVVDEEESRYVYSQRDVSLTRIRKDLWDRPAETWGGKQSDTASRYVSNAPWGVSWIWLSLEDLVREVEARDRDYLRNMGAAPEAGNWIRVLGLQAKEHDLSSVSKGELQRAYRKAVMRTHPDKGGDAEAFHRVQEAYTRAKQALSQIW